MTRKTFGMYLLLGSLILLVSAAVNYFFTITSTPKECKVYVNMDNPSNLVITSNCNLTTITGSDNSADTAKSQKIFLDSKPQ